MQMTGKRHPFWSRYRAGFTADGRITALEVFTYADGGWSVDLTPAILDRALFHTANAYYIPNLRFEGRAVRTNTASNTAFRGFGGPQGMLIVEDAMSRAAERLGIDPAELRRRNYYGVEALDGGETALPEGQVEEPLVTQLHARRLTPYYQDVEDCRLPRIHRELLQQADYAARRAEIDAFNARSPLRQARPRLHAGQVRHLVHQLRAQPGRRAGAGLHGRQRAAQPRRHRDGPGPAQQDAGDLRPRARRARGRRSA